RMRRDLLRAGTLANGVKVVRVGIGSSFDKWLFPFVAPFAVRRLRPQVVHAVLESFAGLAMVFCRFLCPSAKRILTCQSTNTSFLVGLMHRAADHVTVISSVLLERANGFGKEAALIPNGIDGRAIAEACALFPKVPGRVLFVGRLEPMKGVDTLLAALASLTPGPSPAGRGEHLRIVGDGSLRKELAAQAARLGIADRVTFVGYVPVPAVYGEFAQAEIFVGLSRSEALGNVFLEAQAAGCAVIGTKVGGIPDIVEDGVTGMLVPPDDAEAARTAIERLLQSSDERSRLATAGKDHAKHYDWDAITERYAQIYIEALR
ncbi:MAG: glycosyltransferase family 4 protein, partial [Candidatus Peribacteraceae bacterium]|nr:glycosyltransferase family 4 protein [Candidatus Peribacteraceae bacterium]